MRISPAEAAPRRIALPREASAALWPPAGRGRRILVAGTAGLGAFLLALGAAEPHYTARSVVVASGQPVPGAEAGPGSPAEAPEAGAREAQLGTEIEIIRSEALLGALAARLRLAQEPEFNATLPLPPPAQALIWPSHLLAAMGRWLGAGEARRPEVTAVLRRHVSVRQGEDAGTLVIQAWSQEPGRAVLLADTLAELYVRRTLDERVAATTRALDVLRGRLEDLRQRLGGQDAEAPTAPAELRAMAARNRALRLELLSLGQGLQAQRGALEPAARISLRAEQPAAVSRLAGLVPAGLTGLASGTAAAFLLTAAARLRRRRAVSAPEAPVVASGRVAEPPVGAENAAPEEEPRQATRPEARRPALREAFAPDQPQRSALRFVGRREQRARITRAILEEQAHVCLHGEPGRGKTSLANCVAEAAHAAGLAVARHACTPTEAFGDVLRGLARSLPAALLAGPIRDAGSTGCEAALPAGPLQPWHVLALPAQLTRRRLLFIVDDFGRLPEEAGRRRVAEAIRLLSAHGAPASFLILGGSDALAPLLGHPSAFQRGVVGVPLPLLQDAELDDLILRGARHCGLVFPPRVRACIVALARGLPGQAQLLALRAGEAAQRRGEAAVGAVDLRHAIEQAVADAAPRLIAQYEGLTDGEAEAPMTSLLRAIAAGEQDRFGRFRTTRVPDGHLVAAGASATPELWARLLDAGVVRTCAGEGADLCRFAEPGFPHYVLLRMARLILALGAPR